MITREDLKGEELTDTADILVARTNALWDARDEIASLRSQLAAALAAKEELEQNKQDARIYNKFMRKRLDARAIQASRLHADLAAALAAKESAERELARATTRADECGRLNLEARREWSEALARAEEAEEKARELQASRTPGPATAELVDLIQSCLEVAGVSEVHITEDLGRRIAAEWPEQEPAS